MPFIILGLLLVIAVILYLTFVSKEGDPSLKTRPFSDLLNQIFQTPDKTTNDNEGDKTENTSGQKPPVGGESTGSNNEAKTPDTEVKTPDTADDKNAEQEKAFQSMEELTEFYRREAEKLTGIKH